MEVVPEAKEEAKLQGHNEVEQQGCPSASMWFLLVLASALLPARAECTAWAGAPRCIQQKKREVSGQLQRSCDPVHRSRGSDRPEVRQGGFSILNSCVLRAFRVTAEGLAKEDAGSLRCGMQKGFFPFHESADVEVITTPIVTPTLGARDHAAGGGFTPRVTGTQGPSGTRCIHPSPASATPTLSPDAPQGSRGTFRYFPVLAGLQLLALLATSAAVLGVSVRGR
ncbi:uncharacterized protein LOC143695531 [Agelaius phoeniceus]|uniref:uncharacterized protein LOC143695531 n=1 Tax=Agelaius phoeniceus TaxID=39638 RepID=UPI004054B0BE